MLKGLAVVLVVVAMGTAQTEKAFAQTQPAATAVGSGDRIAGNAAGAVGLGLLGAEATLFLVPAFKLQDHWWAWVLFPAIGGAAGGIAGAFAFDPHDPKPAVTVSLLGVGMLLAVPAIVGASALASKRRGQELEQVQGGVLRFSKKGTSFGAPTITTAQVFSPQEQSRYNLPQRSSTRVSLISGTF